MRRDNFVAALAESLRANRAASCFSNLDQAPLTYGEVARRIAALHACFEALGLVRGDRIALVGRNTVNWGVTYLAAVTCGAVIVPVLPDFTPAEIEHIVRHSGAALLVAAEPIFDGLEPEKMLSLRGVYSLHDLAPLWTSGEALPRLDEAGAPSEPAFPDSGGDELAAIVYTSGTTGFSKGVMLTHDSLLANVDYYSRNVELNPEDVIVSFLPLAHAFGCAFDFLAPFVCGCHIVFVEKIPSPKILVAAFAKYRPVVVMSVPLIIEKIFRNRVKPILEGPRMQAMLKVPLLNKVIERKIRDRIYGVFGGNYREMVVGGAALNKEIELFFRRIGLNLTCGYGMTECGPLISYTVKAGDPPAHSVGRVIPSLECRIAGAHPTTGIGEVLVRGRNVMRGYYRDEEATAEAIDAEGWLHTGDLGRMDDQGFLFLTGRSKNMILSSSGQNIYPEEIESQLNNLPCVEESLVVDHDGRLVALVYPDLESVDRACLKGRQVEDLMEENRRRLNDRLPGYAQIAKLKVRYEEFEKTPTKKIKRNLYSPVP